MTGADLRLRPVSSGDREFLFRVYASTRAQELAAVPWDEAARQGFLRAQFEAQDRWYRENYEHASYEIVLIDGEPVGRLWLHRGLKEIRIMDIALLPEHRDRGIGTSLLRRVLAEGDATARSVTIHVERLSPALGLYERLGFSVREDKGVYLFLERIPAS